MLCIRVIPPIRPVLQRFQRNILIQTENYFQYNQKAVETVLLSMRPTIIYRAALITEEGLNTTQTWQTIFLLSSTQSHPIWHPHITDWIRAILFPPWAPGSPSTQVQHRPITQVDYSWIKHKLNQWSRQSSCHLMLPDSSELLPRWARLLFSADLLGNQAELTWTSHPTCRPLPLQRFCQRGQDTPTRQQGKAQGYIL